MQNEPLSSQTTQRITDILAEVIPIRPFRAALLDVAIAAGGKLECAGIVIYSDYQSGPLNLGTKVTELQTILMQLAWPLKIRYGEIVNKAHFYLDYGAWKLHYSLRHDEDYQWLQTCPPSDANYQSLTELERQQITSWVGLPENHPRPWVTPNK